MSHDTPRELLDRIARFIGAYRTEGAPPALMLEAVLAEFPDANSSDFSRGLLEANRRERVGPSWNAGALGQPEREAP